MSGFMVCANDDYLRFICGGNLGVLSYNMWWLVNLIFPLLLGLFGVSWSFKFLVLDDILILLSWVSWWSCVNLMEASHKVGDNIEWVNFINWTLCLVN